MTFRCFRFLTRALLLALIGVLFAVDALGATKSSTLAVTPDGERLLVVNTDSHSVSFLNISGIPFVETEVLVGSFPQTITIDSVLSRAYVVNRGDNSLSVIDLGHQRVMANIGLEDEPFAVVANERYLFVSNQGSNSISVIHKDTMMPLLNIDTLAAPKGLSLSADGLRLFVTHFFTGHISVIDTKRMQVIHEINTSSMANLSQSILLDESGDRAYLPQTFSNTQNAALLFDTTVMPVVSVIDLETMTNVRADRISVDVIDRPVGIPIDVALTDSKILYIVNAASNDVSVINLRNGKAVAHIEVGANPRGVVLSADEQKVFVNNSLSGSVTIIDASSQKILSEVVVTSIPLSSNVLNGKKLFNSSDSADLARDQWIACASCHFDGGHDARTWLFRDGPRNTPSLFGVAETLPIHWSGDLDELQDVEIAVRDIQGGHGLIPGSDNCSPSCDQGPPNTGRSNSMEDLVLYMQTLQITLDLTQNKRNENDALTQAGEQLFNSAEIGCANCHTPPLYTDKLRHDVGTGLSPLEQKGSLFDTPSLRGIRTSAPYFHDGSAKTLSDLLAVHNPGYKQGDMRRLSDFEIHALEHFLWTLPFKTSETSDHEIETIPTPVSAIDTPVLALELRLAKEHFRENDAFDLSLHVAGQGIVDLYVAIQFPDRSFVTLGPDMRISSIDQVVALESALHLRESMRFNALSVILPADLPEGFYTAHAIAVRPAANVLDVSNWITTDTLSFVFSQ